MSDDLITSENKGLYVSDYGYGAEECNSTCLDPGDFSLCHIEGDAPLSVHDVTKLIVILQRILDRVPSSFKEQS